MDPALVTDIIFLLCSISAVGFSLLVIFFKNPIYSSLCLVGSFIPIAVIFLLMYASFIAVIQILVYAGAIMVLFTFVIMMIDLKEQDFKIEKSIFYKLTSLIISVGLLIAMLLVVKPFSKQGSKPTHIEISEHLDKNRENFGSTKAIGELIFGKPLSIEEKIKLSASERKKKENENTLNSLQIISFELSSILIMIAIIGALILGKSRKKTRKS